MRWTCSSAARLARELQDAGHRVSERSELVGPFKNAGREWRPHGHPEPVRVHDFPDKALGKAIPYGVYDLTRDAGWVSVGVDHGTASFAVETLRRWWGRMGCVSYPAARRVFDHG